jgi:hypothetical protein
MLPSVSFLANKGNRNLGMGGVMIAVAAFVLGKIGFSQTQSASDLRLVFYSLAWLIGIAGVCAAAWGIVNILAHRQVEQHWCPDPEAHRLPAVHGNPGHGHLGPTGPTGPPGPPGLVAELPLGGPTASAVHDNDQLRSVFRQLRMDLKSNAHLLDQAVRNGRYWPIGGPQLTEKAWKKNRQQLFDYKDVDEELFDSLSTAFGHVTRLAAKMLPRRYFQKSVPKLEDDLSGALAATYAAFDKIDDALRAGNAP